MTTQAPVSNAPELSSPAENAPPQASELPVGASEFAAFEAAQAAQAAAPVEPAPVEPPAGTPPAETPPAETPPPPAAEKPKGRAADRINELVRKSREAERTVEATTAELAAARARIAELERSSAAPAPAPPTPPPAPAAPSAPKGPSPDDKNPDGTDKYPFGVLDSAYTADLVSFATQQAIAADRQAREKEAAVAKAAEEQEAALSSWADRMERAVQTQPDWVDKVINAGAVGAYDLNESTYQLAVNSEVGTSVLYHLATHPDEAKSLAAITDPVKLALHFGRLESRFLTGAQPAPQPGNGQTVVPQITPPSAPPPPPQVRGSNGQFTVPDSTEDFSAFERKWQGKIG